jgi:hypothetical protein
MKHNIQTCSRLYSRVVLETFISTRFLVEGMSQRALVERTHVTIAQLGIVRGKLSDCILEDTYFYSIVNQIS